MHKKTDIIFRNSIMFNCINVLWEQAIDLIKLSKFVKKIFP